MRPRGEQYRVITVIARPPRRRTTSGRLFFQRSATGLLSVRKTMSAPQSVAYTLWHERPTPARGVGAPPPPRRPARPRRIHRDGGRGVPRRRSSFGPSLGGRISAGWGAGSAHPLLPGAS